MENGMDIMQFAQFMNDLIPLVSYRFLFVKEFQKNRPMG
jgi:hypothetical protein